ncbi:MAG: hypothetical protein ACTS8H_01805 [Arsenophonus sp. NC-PE1-MAG3]
MVHIITRGKQIKYNKTEFTAISFAPKTNNEYKIESISLMNPKQLGTPSESFAKVIIFEVTSNFKGQISNSLSIQQGKIKFHS